MLEGVRLTSIQPLQGGTSIMFYAVAAAVIGGTSLFGGSGTIIGAALGVARARRAEPRLHPAGDQRLYVDLVLGIAIIASMAFNVTLERVRHQDGSGLDVTEPASR